MPRSAIGPGGRPPRRLDTMQKPAEKPPAAPYGRYAWLALGLMVLVYAISFIDRQILSILAERIKADLQVDDAQLGFLYGTAFAIFYTVFGFPLGRLVDHWDRARIMALGLAFWSLMTMLSGFASSLLWLAIARVGVGIGEASASPAAYSMLADYFAERRRALVMAIYSSGIYLGQGLSLPLGGSISTWWDRVYTPSTAPLGLVGWQAAFIAVGLPGLLLAPFIWRLREPQRQSWGHAPRATSAAAAGRLFLSELASIVPPFTFFKLARRPGAMRTNLLWFAGCVVLALVMILLTGDRVQWLAYAFGVFAVASWAQNLKAADPPAYALIWGTPAVVCTLVGFGALSILTYSLAFWSAPFAMRTYGISAERAGIVLGLPMAIACAAGVIVGGRLSDALRARSAGGRAWVGILAAVSSAPLIVATYYAPDFTTFAVLLPVTLMCANTWPATAIAAYQDFVLPRMYGTVGAMFLLGGTMMGLAVGPYAVGKIATATGSLRTGLLCLLLVAPAALVLLWRVRAAAAATIATKAARAAAAGEPAAGMTLSSADSPEAPAPGVLAGWNEAR
jgi:MFS family permease